jgi:hypothetical protein
MIFGHDFYHGTIRRYVIMFGNIFNDMQIKRYDSLGAVAQTLNVPISYGPKQKQIERVLADPDFTRPVSTILPRIGFAMSSMGYNPTRKLNPFSKFQGTLDTVNSNVPTTYAPVPYDFNFQLSILTKNAEDGTQLIEQILPFFVPDYTVTMKVLPDVNATMDIPIELGSVTSDDSYEGDYGSNRILSWDLDFTVKGYLFGPVTTSDYITNAEVAYFQWDDNVATDTYNYIGDAGLNVTEVIT